MGNGGSKKYGWVSSDFELKGNVNYCRRKHEEFEESVEKEEF